MSQLVRSKYGRVATAALLLMLLAGGGVAFADQQQNGQQKTFSASQTFQVYDPAEPVISINVNDSLIGTGAPIVISLSSHNGLTQLVGTYSVVIQMYNDTSGQYEDFSTLASNQHITLTPNPVDQSFDFSTDTPGSYNVLVTFTTISYSTG